MPLRILIAIVYLPEAWGLLDFVLRALRALRPCDLRNDPLDSKQTLVFVVILLLLLLLVVVVVIVLLRKSNARAHISDWCAFALDGVKKVRTNGRTRRF